MFKNVIEWKIWGVISAAILAVFGVLLFKNKKLNKEVDELKDQQYADTINADVHEFQAVNKERKENSKNDKMEIKPNTTYEF